MRRRILAASGQVSPILLKAIPVDRQNMPGVIRGSFAYLLCLEK
jgi:hypothetical protein